MAGTPVRGSERFLAYQRILNGRSYVEVAAELNCSLNFLYRQFGAQKGGEFWLSERGYDARFEGLWLLAGGLFDVDLSFLHASWPRFGDDCEEQT